MSKIIICPICDKEAELASSNPYRPFCSKRCRLIDLGQWIDGTYSITDNTTTENNVDVDSFHKH